LQTFLPYASFADSAKALDRQRLGKQRIEALQILRTLRGLSFSWRNHPAVLMWRGCEGALAAYGLAVCEEWTRRGYKDRCAAQIAALGKRLRIAAPPWLGKERLHRSHQSNLVRKLPGHYRLLWPDIPDDLPYFWPVTKED